MPENERDWGVYRREYNKENYKRINLYLKPEQYERWEKDAKDNGLNMSAFVKQAVEEKIQTDEKAKEEGETII